MKRTLYIALAVSVCLALWFVLWAQEGPPPPEKTSPFKGNLFELQNQQPLAYDENISSILLSRTGTTSAALIQVRDEVKTHYHARHDEVVYILSGKGVMTVGSEKKVVQAGDFIVIERGTPHSVVNKSPQPLTALSVMSPPFDGSDRIYTE